MPHPSPPPILDDAALAAAGHANHLEWFREQTRWTGSHGAIEERDGLLLYASNTDFPVVFNGVVRVDHAVPAGDLIERADAWFGTRERGYSVSIDDRGHDDDLRDALDAAGFVRTGQPPEMVLRSPIDPPAPDAGLRVEWVRDERALDHFLAVCTDSYGTIGMPAGVVEAAISDVAAFTSPWVHTVVVLDRDEPLAAAQVLLSHGIAGIYWVGTVAAARGRGLGETVTRAVTARAFDLGAAAVTLQASPQGEPIYRRLGFETIYHYETWVRFRTTS